MRWPLVLVLAWQAAVGPLATIARGDSSAIDTKREVIVRTPSEWSSLWKAHAPSQSAPAVDFARQTVVGVFLGNRPTSGYSVEVLAARADNGVVVVEWAETRPDPGDITAQVVTAPFHLVSMPAYAGPLRLVEAGRK